MNSLTELLHKQFFK